MAERRLISTSGSIGTYEIDVRDREKVVVGRYDHPVDPKTWQVWVAGLHGDDLDLAYSNHLSAVDLRCRAKNRESIAAESTVVKRLGREVDLMGFHVQGWTIEKAVAAVNSAYENAYAFIPDDATASQKAETIDKLVPAPFRVTRRKLLEEKKARDQDGRLRVQR